MGYMSAHGTAATFVEFTVSHSTVVGVEHTDTVTGANPNARLTTSTTPFTGTDNGGHLTLHFRGYGSTAVVRLGQRALAVSARATRQRDGRLYPYLGWLLERLHHALAGQHRQRQCRIRRSALGTSQRGHQQS